MNKSLYKIVIGIFFIGAGIYGYFSTTGIRQLIAILIGVYGIYNIGWGVYLKKKGGSSDSNQGL